MHYKKGLRGTLSNEQQKENEGEFVNITTMLCYGEQWITRTIIIVYGKPLIKTMGTITKPIVK